EGPAGARKGVRDVMERGELGFESGDVLAVVLAPVAGRERGGQRGLNVRVRWRPRRRPFGPDRRAAEEGGEVGCGHTPSISPRQAERPMSSGRGLVSSGSPCPRFGTGLGSAG